MTTPTQPDSERATTLQEAGIGTGESRPNAAEAIMAALTVPHNPDAETPQYTNVIDGLHAVAGASRPADGDHLAVDPSAGSADRTDRAHH